MAETLKVRKVGNSLGLILSQPVAEFLKVREGDQLYITQTKDGIKISPYDPDFASAVEDARRFMHSHRNAFKKLAE